MRPSIPFRSVLILPEILSLLINSLRCWSLGRSLGLGEFDCRKDDSLSLSPSPDRPMGEQHILGSLHDKTKQQQQQESTSSSSSSSSVSSPLQRRLILVGSAATAAAVAECARAKLARRETKRGSCRQCRASRWTRSSLQQQQCDSLLSPLCLYTAQHSNKKAEDVCVFVEERREERRGETLKQKQTTRRLLFLLGLERRGLELLQEFAAAASAAAVVVAPSEKATQIHRSSSSSSSSSSLCLH